MQVCTSFQTDNHASNPHLSFLQAGKALKEILNHLLILTAKCHVYACHVDVNLDFTSCRMNGLYKGKKKDQQAGRNLLNRCVSDVTQSMKSLQAK